jgi:AbrB family looped-hinge helix DNA binding protein
MEISMSRLATTKLSSKGQVVIPEEIRNQMKLHTGDQFLVVAEKDVVILKAITPPDLREYTHLITKTRLAAKKAGLTKDTIKDAIAEARKK